MGSPKGQAKSASHRANIASALRGRTLSEGHCKNIALGKMGGGTHRKSRTDTYSIWQGMRQRCSNPKNTGFNWYGGRGIKVCDRWLKFENFLADMGERPPDATLDRIDNDGNYEPGNVRWATRYEQAQNRRPKTSSRR